MQKLNIETPKTLIDFIKWLASLATLVMGGGGFALSGKLSGGAAIVYVIAVCLFLASVICGLIGFFGCCAMIETLEAEGQFGEESYNPIGTFIIAQIICFIVGLIVFMADVVVLALSKGL